MVVIIITNIDNLMDNDGRLIMINSDYNYG